MVSLCVGDLGVPTRLHRVGEESFHSIRREWDGCCPDRYLRHLRVLLSPHA